MPKFESDEKSPMSKRASEKNSVQQVDVEPLNQYVCERVKFLRKKKGWTLEQLASLSGVSR